MRYTSGAWPGAAPAVPISSATVQPSRSRIGVPELGMAENLGAGRPPSPPASLVPDLLDPLQQAVAHHVQLGALNRCEVGEGVHLVPPGVGIVHPKVHQRLGQAGDAVLVRRDSRPKLSGQRDPKIPFARLHFPPALAILLAGGPKLGRLLIGERELLLDPLREALLDALPQRLGLRAGGVGILGRDLAKRGERQRDQKDESSHQPSQVASTCSSSVSSRSPRLGASSVELPAAGISIRCKRESSSAGSSSSSSGSGTSAWAPGRAGIDELGNGRSGQRVHTATSRTAAADPPPIPRVPSRRIRAPTNRRSTAAARSAGSPRGGALRPTATEACTSAS